MIARIPATIALRGMAALSLAVLSACAPPSGGQAAAGAPETLTEVVNMRLAEPAHLARLQAMLAVDPPSHAELACDRGNAFCAEAEAMLSRRGVPTLLVPKPGRDLTLVYERTATVRLLRQEQ